MIQCINERIHDFFDIAVIHHPSEFGIQGTLHHDVCLEAVPVKPPAFVSLWNMRQGMRGFESERLDELHLGHEEKAIKNGEAVNFKLFQ